MKRKLISMLLVLVLLLSLTPFATAAGGTDEALEAAETLHALGLFQGTGTGADGTPNFSLDRAPTRQEAVTMLVRLLGKEAEAQAGDWELPFTDVDAWARPYVGYAYANGLTTGTAATRFSGASPATASQYITFVLRALGYSSDTDFAWDSAWTLSDQLGITDGRYTAATKAFSRGDVAIVSRNALYAQLKDGETTLGASLGLVLPGAAALTVHFLDVGQADCILAESNGRYMLIDAGNNADEQTILDYLRAQGVQTLDYVIGTHPHEDHIGALDAVIRNFDVKTVILPQKAHTTQTYENVLDAVADKGLTLTAPVLGQRYALGNATFTILSPRRDYGDNLNNWSVGIRLCYGNTEFVLCGDAEAEAEADIVSSGLTLTADVLKLSHHGSATSTSDAFLDAVNPSYAVISCGKDNDYGHPHAETLEKLSARGITVFRTDEQGTVIAATDGKRISWVSHPGATADEPAAETSYVLNTSTMKFHRPDCASAASIAAANRQDSSLARDALIDLGYSPCGVCKP